MENTFLLFLTQLLGQAPILLAYLAGVILALVFWRRCPGPAKLTFIAMLLLLITSLVHSFLFSYFLQVRVELGWSHEQVGLIMSAIGLLASLIRVTALALLLTAVFIGRKVARDSRPNEALLLTEPASRVTVEHGIISRPSSGTGSSTK